MGFLALAAEQLTIDDTPGGIAITPSKFQDSNSQDLNILMGVFSYDLGGAGGGMWHNGGLLDPTAISATGGNGEIPEVDPNKWRIWGLKSLKDWRGIRDGAGNAIIQITLYGLN